MKITSAICKYMLRKRTEEKTSEQTEECKILFKFRDTEKQTDEKQVAKITANVYSYKSIDVMSEYFDMLVEIEPCAKIEIGHCYNVRY